MKTRSIGAVLDLYQPGQGAHFFDADSKRFFSSRISDACYESENGAFFFVTSEKGSHQSKRRYTVRACIGPKKIESVCGFQAFASLSLATSAAKKEAARNLPWSFYTTAASLAVGCHKQGQLTNAEYWLKEASIALDTPSLWSELERIHA